MMLGTLFEQLCLTECFHEKLGKRQFNMYANGLTSKWMMAFNYPCFSCNRLKSVHACEMDVAVLQVMYDASGVRLHAGKQATVLNIIISQLPADHPGSGETPLRDRLGHTPRQVQLHCNGASLQWCICMSCLPFCCVA